MRDATRSRPLAALLVMALGVAWLPTAAQPAAAQAAQVTLSKDMAARTLYGDTTAVTLTATNPGDGGADGYNTSFRDVLAPGVSLAEASPAPSRSLLQGDGSTVLVWENVADLQDGASVSIEYSIAHDPGAYAIGDVIPNDASVYTSADARLVPDFDPTTGVATGDFDASSSDAATTELIPFELTIAEPSAEAELLRGVHDHQTVYTLTVQNNHVLATDTVVLEAWLPPGLEFLGCGDVDNSSPGEEYTGSGRINPGNAPATTSCVIPSLVETAEIDPDGAGPSPFGVHTHVRWSTTDLGTPTLGAGDSLEVQYVAGVPLHANAPFADPAPATDGAQAANLDNNTGALTTDEQSLVTAGLVTGTTGGVVHTDDDADEVVAEDVSIHKGVAPGTLEQARPNTWTLLVETGEYTTASGPVTVTDTVPDGLSVTGGDHDAASENPDGTWTATWDLATVPAPSGSTSLTLETTTDADYTTRGGGAPVSSLDAVTNGVTLAAPTMAIIVAPDTTTSEFAHADASSASISGAGITISKQVAQPPAIGTPVDCFDGTPETWVDSADDYTPGDRVCWRLVADFPTDLDTPDVEVVDLLPAGYEFQSWQAGGGDTVGPPTTFAAEGDELTWTFTNVDTGGLRFEAVVETLLVDAEAVTSGDLTDNLLKVTHEDTDGAVYQSRDSASAEAVEPQLVATKSVADVDDDATGFPAASALAQGGDVVTFQVVVANGGDRDAEAVEVWDLLPTTLGCPTVTGASISHAGSCDDTPDPDRITWSGLVVPAGGSITLTYDVTVPADVAPGESHTNDAGVRTHTATTNTGTPFTYVPADNVDPALVPNTSSARDTASVSIPAATVAKTRTSSVDDAAAGNGDGEAAIGEVVTYSVTATIPEGTTLSSTPTVPVALTDVVPDALTILGTPTYTIDTGAGAGAPTDATVAGQQVTVELASGGADHVNPADSGDDVVVLTFDARVDDEVATGRGDTIRNVGRLGFVDRQGGIVEVTGAVDTSVVEPALQVTKDEDDADDVVAAGDTLTYTVGVANVAGPGVSSAHDVVVVDTVPDQLVPQAGAGGDAGDGDAVTSGGSWDAAARTITWTSAQVAGLAEVVPGGSLDLAYDVRVSDPLTGSGALTNTVELGGTSLAGMDAAERDAGSGYVASTSDTIAANPLVVDKAADVSSATIGEVVTYTVDVTIPASTIVHDVTLLDALPAGVTYVDTVSSSCDQAGPCAPDTLTNLANVHSNGSDRVAGTPAGVPAAGDYDNAEVPASADVDVVEPDVSIDKRVTPTSAEPGDTLTYEVEVSNGAGASASTAHDIVVSDPADDAQFASVTTDGSGLPAGVALTSAGSGAPFTWTIDALAPGASVVLTYTAELDPSADLADDDTVVNTAEATGWTSIDTDSPPAGSGPARTYGTVDDTVTVDLGFPALTHDKAVGAQGADAAVDVPFEWVLTLQNTGDAAARDVDVTDTLPLNWDFDGGAVVEVDDVVVAAPDPAVGTADPVVVAWDDVVASLPAGSTLTITYSATPSRAAQATPGTGAGTPHTNGVVATASDAAGATANADGPYATSAQDPGATTPATADAFLPDPGTVGDAVWTDLDGDALRDAGWETDHGGIGGVTVTLANVDTGTELTTATAADGTYGFTDVPPGTWTVTVDTADPQFPTDLTPTSDADGIDTPHTSTVVVAEDGEDLAQDFAYTGGGTVGDTIWLDLDRNGLQEGLEPGLDGIIVTLRDADGNTVATRVTDADGGYLFTGVPDGDWTVDVTRPAGVDATADPDGGDDDRADLALADGARSRLDQDFGYAGDLSIGDSVWYDLDADGDVDPGWEALHGGIPGVTVTLRDAGTDVATTTTGDDGSYTFANLPPGTWTVVVDATTVPGTVVRTGDADGVGTPDTSTTTLETADDLGQDFGYHGTGTIGDTVWLDLDGDGAVNGDEPGIDGLTVTLVDADGDTVTATTTGAAGDYAFANLPPGTWTVVVTVPAGYEATDDLDGAGSAHTAAVLLGDGEDRADADFGYDGTGSVGDLVWVDLDADGVVDALEPGIADVTVELYLDGLRVAVTTTDAEGAYLFDRLPPGDVRVVVVDATLPPGFAPTSDPDDDGTDHESQLALAADEAALDQDFGYNGDGRLGDRVWLDRDADAVQDAGEPGMAGVTVELLDDTDRVVDTTTTDDDGRYAFAGLLDGDWDVRVVAATLPAGVVQTGDADGTDTPHRSTTTIDAITAPVDLGQDFGYVGDLVVGDTLWLDLDRDGTRGSLEPGLAGVTVRLADAMTGLVVARAVTDADGGYAFASLDARSWRVVVDDTTLPDGLAATADGDGADTPHESTVVLSASDDLLQDFGYAGGLVVGDVVWFDADADGTVDADEPGLGAVSLQLLDATGTTVAATLTADDGTWAFENVPPGTWTVVLDESTLPHGLRPTADGDGTGTPATSTLALDGADDLTQDFGWTGTSSVSGGAWFDDDVDGQRDADEDPAAGVTVHLYDADDLDDPIATVVTDADGAYRFEHLRPGSVVVAFDTASGVVVTPVVDADSDADPRTGLTRPVAVQAETALGAVDVGLVRLAGIGDRVFDDRDGDGLQDPGEPGVAGVDVVLHDAAGGQVAATVTDAAGRYHFPDLLPGDYVVVFDPIEGAVLTDADTGADALDSDADPATGRVHVSLQPGEDDDTVDAGMRLQAELEVAKVLEGELTADGEATYLVTVGNHGPHPAPGTLSIVDDAPDALRFLRADGSDWTCRVVGDDVACDHAGPLPVGETVAVRLVFAVDASEGGTVTNTVGVIADGVVRPDTGAPPTASTGAIPVRSAADAPLPRTGSDMLRWVLLALLSLALGSWLVSAGRRDSLPG